MNVFLYLPSSLSDSFWQRFNSPKQQPFIGCQALARLTIECHRRKLFSYQLFQARLIYPRRQHVTRITRQDTSIVLIQIIVLPGCTVAGTDEQKRCNISYKIGICFKNIYNALFKNGIQKFFNLIENI